MSSIVQYDLTSSKDVKDLDQTYVYSSSKLSPLSASEFLFEPPAEEDQSEHSEQKSVLVLESDSASDEAGPSTSASKTNTPVRQCLKWLENIANNTAAAAPIYIASSSESKEQDNEFSRLPLLSDGASSDFEIIASTLAGASIYLSSSSELDDQVSGALLPGRKPYYIGLQELPASLREFLAEAYAFFTSSHQQERAGQRVSLTTYGKAQEPILCEYCLFISLKYDSERNVAQTRVCLLKLE